MDTHDHGLIFVISAPAGTGKTTLVNMLTAEFPSIVRNVSYTTRTPRPGEKEGEDYYFLTKEAFEKKLLHNDFFEHAQVFGEYYGTSKETVLEQRKKGKHVVLVIDTQGALQIKESLKAIFIFITPPSFAELKKRLIKRETETLQHTEKRLAWASQEIEMLSHYDYRIVNDDLALAYHVLKSIVVAEEHKIRRN